MFLNTLSIFSSRNVNDQSTVSGIHKNTELKQEKRKGF